MWNDDIGVLKLKYKDEKEFSQVARLELQSAYEMAQKNSEFKPLNSSITQTSIFKPQSAEEIASVDKEIKNCLLM